MGLKLMEYLRPMIISAAGEGLMHGLPGFGIVPCPKYHHACLPQVKYIISQWVPRVLQSNTASEN